MSDFKIALFDELTPLYPDSNIKDGYDNYTVACANNSFGGIHILLKDLIPGQPVIFNIKGPDRRCKLFQLESVPVEVNTGLESRSEWLDNKINPTVIRRAPFMIYEVLNPIVNICNAKYSTMAFAFRCKINIDDFCRFDNWQITVSHCGTSKTVQFTVQSFKCAVEPVGKDSYPYINWLSDSAISSSHHVTIWSREWEILLERYLRMAYYGRQNMFCIWPHWCFEIGDNNIPILNEAKLTKLIEIANHVGIYWLCGGTIIQRINGDWEATAAEITMNGDPLPGKGQNTLNHMATSIFTYIKKNNLTNRWIQSLLDEPVDSLSEVYKLGSNIIKQTMPNIPILEATIARESIEGDLNIWCPTVDHYEKYNDFFTKRKKKGDKVFVYTCLNPAGNYCNRQLDVERLRQVYLGWAPAKYGVDGFLHWGGNMYSMLNPYELSSITFGGETPTLNSVNYDLNYSSTLPPGDNCIIYPGYNTPLSSTRLEAHRIGFEDLSLLRQGLLKDKNITLALINDLFRGYNDFEKSVDKYRLVKKELLEFLVTP